jgi:hypothetical protein
MEMVDAIALPSEMSRFHIIALLAQASLDPLSPRRVLSSPPFLGSRAPATAARVSAFFA